MRKTKMYFKTLPKDIQTAIMNLTKDEEFQRRFRTDKILDEIDEMKENLDDEYQSFLALMNKKIKIKRHWEWFFGFFRLYPFSQTE